MRIVAGEYGGRRLKAVSGMKTRPTTDKVKEAMFNIIGPYFEGGKSIDLFSGSGGLSIEGVSRGIEEATLIDRQYQAIKTIKENVAVTKHSEKFKIIKGDANKIIHVLAKKQLSYDLVYFDPPYKEQKIVEMMLKLAELSLLNKNAIIVCETDQEANLPDEISGFKWIKKADYGITQLNIYEFEGGE
ncbi:16S rRNA (guanine(966)-N(2))-methyltransferase RsmD [Ligilactobacillus salivarius]|uniref:16S rRNA (guanine(966)-N(2))-methyltransferase RsmD n=1 Tax=Ligilactobacillus salivarius TaxID=1624 RepID=UPI003B02246E